MNATHDCAHRRVLKCVMLLQSDNKIRDGIDREDIKAVRQKCIVSTLVLLRIGKASKKDN